jgi:2-polyprenyl-3-methyl-5-hydroxy-6-metoxy-1,4-benzoquinol methylase
MLRKKKSKTNTDQKATLFRNTKGEIKNIFSELEGVTYKENPFDIYMILARYKFASRFIKKNHKVLDAGCGTGMGSQFLAKFSNFVTAGDYDKNIIMQNKDEYKNVNFKFLDLLNIEKSMKNKFDVVVSMDVIEHFELNKIKKVTDNYANLLNKNGFAVIGTPNIASRPFASERRKAIHPHEFSANEFEKSLKKSFKNVFLFSMTDEIVSTQFLGLSWYLMALCTK